MQFSTVALLFTAGASAQILGAIANTVAGITDTVAAATNPGYPVGGVTYGFAPAVAGPPRAYGGDYSLGRYCRDLNIPSRALPP